MLLNRSTKGAKNEEARFVTFVDDSQSAPLLARVLVSATIALSKLSTLAGGAAAMQHPEKNPVIEDIIRDSAIVGELCAAINRSLEEPAENGPYARLPADTRISYCNRMFRPGQRLLDALGRPYEGMEVPSGEYIALLIDPDPQANWSHPCWVAAVDLQLRWQLAHAAYPPLECENNRLVNVNVPAQALAA
jgi:hypothetical protein